MRPNSTWRPATSVFVILCIAVTQMEVKAFGQKADALGVAAARSKSEAQERPHSGERVVSAALATVPLIRSDVAAQPFPQAGATATLPRLNQADAPTTAPHKGGKGKWIVILAVAAGAAAAVLLTQKKKTSTTSETPTITVGLPTIGQP